jgi:hypothetical protein
MPTQIYFRLIWQIPVLVFLVAVLIPNFPWYLSSLGAWPVWLLSMPFTVFVRRVYSNKLPREDNHRMKSAQVLVFNKQNRISVKLMPKNQRAA